MLFFAYVMFCLYCLLNMFLAILNESYAVVKLADALEPPPTFAAIALVKAKLKNLMKFLVKNQQTAKEIGQDLDMADTDGDGLVGIEELVEVRGRKRLSRDVDILWPSLII